MRKARQIVGGILFCMGVMGADSESLLIPMLMIAVGVWLFRELWIGE